MRPHAVVRHMEFASSGLKFLAGCAVKAKVADYSEYVEHPRYGRGPRFSGIRPEDIPLGYRMKSYVSARTIGGTAVKADLEKQSFSCVPVLYYFDLERQCVDCGRPFIFFAEEQKHWYETLGFALDADCIRCIDCRNREHTIQRMRRRYEELLHRQNLSIEEQFEVVENALALIECGVFSTRLTERVRMILNRILADLGDASDPRYVAARQRCLELEA